MQLNQIDGEPPWFAKFIWCHSTQKDNDQLNVSRAGRRVHRFTPFSDSLWNLLSSDVRPFWPWELFLPKIERFR